MEKRLKAKGCSAEPSRRRPGPPQAAGPRPAGRSAGLSALICSCIRPVGGGQRAGSIVGGSSTEARLLSVLLLAALLSAKACLGRQPNPERPAGGDGLQRAARQTDIRPHISWADSFSAENNNNNNITGGDNDEDADIGPADADDNSNQSDNNNNDALDSDELGTPRALRGPKRVAKPQCKINGGNGNSNSSSADISQDAGGSEDLPTWVEKLIDCVVYCIFITLFLFGVSTNSLTLYAVGRKRLLAPMDIYIIALAMNDLIYCLFALPIVPLYVLYYGDWVFGYFGCKSVAFLTSFSVHNSSLIVVNIAHLRFRLVVHPFEPKVTTLVACLRSLIACSLATLITIPYLLTMVHRQSELDCTYSCSEDWGPDEGRKWRRFLFSLFTTNVQFLMPLIGFEYYYKPIRDKLILMERTHSHAACALAEAKSARRHRQHQQQQHRHSPPDSPPPALGRSRQQQQLELSEIKSSPASSSSALALNQSAQSGCCESQSQSQSPPPPPQPPTHQQQPHLQQPQPHPHLQQLTAGNHNSNNNTNNNNSNYSTKTDTSTNTTTNSSKRPHCGAANKPAGCISSNERERIRQMHLLFRLKQTRKVVYFFSFTWFPLNVFNLIDIWFPLTSAHVYVHLLVQAIACGGVCLNPLMYPLSNDNYRQEFENILPACLIRKLDSLLKA